MWHNRRASKAWIIVGCFLLVWIAGCGNGNGKGSDGGNATTVALSHSYFASAASLGMMQTQSMSTTNAAAFRVTSIEMSVTPTTTSTWKCGSSIQVVYNAVFHVVSGPNGGTIVFSYTLNNGRSQTPEKLTILPGQHLSNFVFTWQGSLPRDHTSPGPGGVFVTSPNSLRSPMIFPAGGCR
jgi:hypothetical protein